MFHFLTNNMAWGNVYADNMYFILLSVFFPLLPAHSIKSYFVLDNSYSSKYQAPEIPSAYLQFTFHQYLGSASINFCMH
jgi:hypothetical protein